jgi:hypothetical protein
MANNPQGESPWMKTTLVKIRNVPLNSAKKFGVHFILFFCKEALIWLANQTSP